jgi:hypothetical protein
MWIVTNATPYVADCSWVQDKNANKIWLVVVKATFSVLPDGSCKLAEEQLPVLKMLLPSGELGASSPIYEADFQGVKIATDVLMRAHAWAPGGRPARFVDTQLSVGPITKRLRVSGDRIWERAAGGSVRSSGPVAFDSMPIVYERAYGGWDRSSPVAAEHRLESRNPIGTGFAAAAAGCLGKLLPNVEYSDQLIDSWKDRPMPAGLNAVECHWTPRRELAGTYDDHWLANRAPLWAEDFDTRYHNCAPRDQQVDGFLRGGEVVHLWNLCSSGQMAFRLPRIYLFFETRFGGERVEHRAQLCTVVIEPDVPRVIMSWQSSLVCNHRVDELDETVIIEKRMI